MHALKLIAPYLRGEVLSLGYPDLEVSIKDIESLFGFTPEKTTDANEWHGKKDPFPETLEVFEKLGVKLTVVDFTADRGMETIKDLNLPQELGRFDLVIDPGTIEHCFNIGQALLNAANAVKVGGRILHLNPMTMLNHGFYNLNPTLFHDFYGQNGWGVSDLTVMLANTPTPHLTKRFMMYPEYLIRTFAMRVNDEPLKMPVQEKYLQKMRAK